MNASPESNAHPKSGVHPLRVGWLAVRPFSFSASLVPVLVGGGIVFASGNDSLADFPWLHWTLALLGALLIQITANLVDEYADHRRTASEGKYAAPHKVIRRGLMNVRQVRIAAATAAAAAFLIGAYLVSQTGAPLLLLLLLGALVAWGYSAGPWPLGDHALGELTVFLLMGWGMVLGTCYILTQGTLNITWEGLPLWQETLWISLPVGCLVTAILVINNLRDIEEDRQQQRRTLATWLGPRFMRRLYELLLLLAYLIPLFCTLRNGYRWPLLLTWITLPRAFLLWKPLWQGTTERTTLHQILRGTATLHLLYGILLTAGLIFTRQG